MSEPKVDTVTSNNPEVSTGTAVNNEAESNIANQQDPKNVQERITN